MSRRGEEEKTLSFSEIRRQLSSGEDFVLANKLQNREFEMHYSHNRNVNGTIVSDRKKTKEEQRLEDEQAASLRRWGQNQRCLTDEEIARQLQEEFDRVDASEQFAKDEQLREDERIARMMMESSSNYPSSSSSSSSSEFSSISNPSSFSGFTNYGAEHLTTNTDLLIPVTQYDNMANRFLENERPPTNITIQDPLPQSQPPPTNLTYHPPTVLSPTNPFLQDVQAYLARH